MNKIVHDLGLDVHKDSIAVSIAPQNSTEVRRYPQPQRGAIREPRAQPWEQDG